MRDSDAASMSKDTASTSTKFCCFFKEAMMDSNRLPKSFQRERKITCQAIFDYYYVTKGEDGAQYLFVGRICMHVGENRELWCILKPARAEIQDYWRKSPCNGQIVAEHRLYRRTL